MTTALTELWMELERGPLQPGITRRRFLPEAVVDVFVGLEKADRVRLVYIEASSLAVASWGKTLPEAAGFTVRLESVDGEPSSARLIVRLTARTYQDVFTALVTDVLNSLVGPGDEQSAVVAFILRLERWQRFLAHHGAEGLTKFEQRGLFGELWFLREYVLTRNSATESLESWTGPLAKDQDFQFVSCSVEVKTSGGNPDQSIHITNVRQLDASASGQRPLFLLHLALDERHAQGESLVAIVEDLRDILGDNVARFNERMLEAGYADLHAAQYTSPQYVVKDHQFYRVEGDFPRILESELRPGVGGIKYSVAIGACAPFVIASDEVIRTIASSQ